MNGLKAAGLVLTFVGLMIVSIFAAIVSLIIAPIIISAVGLYEVATHKIAYQPKRVATGFFLSPSGGPMLASYFLFGRKAKNMWKLKKSTLRLIHTVYSIGYWLLFFLVLAVLALH